MGSFLPLGNFGRPPVCASFRLKRGGPRGAAAKGADPFRARPAGKLEQRRGASSVCSYYGTWRRREQEMEERASR